MACYIAYKAFHKGYKAKYVKASWKYLCDLLAWEYRPNKRNKRTRQEHLWYLQKIRKIQKEEKELQIKRLLELGYSKTQIAEILGMSRRNLYKTYGYLLKT
jgi:DNA-binding NarL/FixJ family response regulator